MNNYLYSPWRIDYILSEKENRCIFCVKPDEHKDEAHLILYRGKTCFVILNAYPYNNGHLMIVPNRHIATLSALQDEERNELFECVQKCESIIKTCFKPEGINVGINLGKAAGAGIDSHLHVHLVPRWSGDVNFMTAIGGFRVIPDSFERVYKVYKEQFDRVFGEK